MRHRRLPRLFIEVPCPADWRAMEPIAGDSRARLCRQCDKPVYDSRSMTRDQLYDLIMKTEGSLPCLRLHQRPDGTVVTKGCLGTLYRAGRYLWLQLAALAVAFWAGLLGLRHVCDTAMAPQPISLERDRAYAVTGGLVTFVKEPNAEMRWLRAPPANKTDPDHAPPLRVLESEEELMPPGWR
jgi:hypothetical protein